MSEKIVYRLAGGITVTETEGRFYVRKNGHLTGIYNDLETALDMQRYEYCEDNELERNNPESKEKFLENYEREYDMVSGIEAFLTDFMNAKLGDRVFYIEDYCIYAPTYIPVGDEPLDKLVTQRRIREALATYLNPFLEEPVEVNWLTIRSN